MFYKELPNEQKIKLEMFVNDLNISVIICWNYSTIQLLTIFDGVYPLRGIDPLLGYFSADECVAPLICFVLR